MPNIYDFRSGRSLKNVDPQQVGEELERIRAQNGQLLAKDVLESAASPESPLHNAFEWDDSAAARQHRLTQARRLIVSVRILNGPVQTATPAFVSVRTPQGRQFVPTVEAMSDDVLKARVLQEIKQFLEGIQRRYSHFEEVAELIGNIAKKVG